MGDEDIESADDVHSAMSGTKAEEEMKIQIVRKGESQLRTLTLGGRPEDQLVQHFEMINGNNSFTVRSPKMLFHGMPPAAPKFPRGLHKEIRVITESEGEIENMREELEKMKSELMEMREGLDELRREDNPHGIDRHELAQFYVYLNLQISILQGIRRCYEEQQALDWQQFTQARF